MRIVLSMLTLLLIALPASGRTWRVEKDGSGDFSVIQDALDAAAFGDTIQVGPGRFDNLHETAALMSGFQFQSIAHVKKSGLTLIGAGSDLTTIGPDSLVMEIDGLTAGALYLDTGKMTHVEGFTIENVQFPVTVRSQSEIANCRIIHSSTSDAFAMTIIEGAEVEVRDCEFFGSDSIITSSPAVTNPRIIDCSFDNPNLDGTAVVIGNGATGALIAGCIVTGYASGVETSFNATATIEDTHFREVRIDAIDLSSGSIVMRRCRIDEGNRFPIRAARGTIEIHDSVIGGGTMATILRGSPVEILVRNSNILNGGALTIDALGRTVEPSDFRYNWWGTTDLQKIDSWISQPDDTVLYEPILDQSVAAQSSSLGSLKALFSPR